MKSGAAALCVVLAWNPPAWAASDGLRGEYGFISSAALYAQPEAEARARVAVMAREFGIREFMLYDWFADYSTPARGEGWKDAFFGSHEISRETIRVTIDEIHRHGGRAWAYVQAVGAEEPDLEDPAADLWRMRSASGEPCRHPTDRPARFPVYFPNAAWARLMVGRWAPSIRAFGFDGIHWDTLGPLAGDPSAEAAGVRAFLRTARDLLAAQGLRQTLNFVELHWWDPALIRETCEFPYAEIWFTGTEQRLYEAMAHPALNGARGVMAMYPKADRPAGWSDTDLLLARAAEARKHNLVYVAVGDGARRLNHEYWPDTAPLNEEERTFFRAPPPAAPRPDDTAPGRT